MNREAEEAVNGLLRGNEAFRASQGPELAKHVAGQSPKAIILTCSDSRVPPELIFNAAIGEIFVIRDAGNIAFGSSVIGSIEYAVEHLHTPLLVIMGHTNCGALKAAESGPGDDSPIGDIVNEVRCCFGSPDNLRTNVKRQAKVVMERSPVIAAAVNSGKLEIRGAIYHLETGEVEFL